MASNPSNQDLHSVLKASTLLDDSNGASLNEVFLNHYTEVEVSSESEWLSNFVEECLSSAGNCFPPSKDTQNLINTNPNPKPYNKRPYPFQNPKSENPSIPWKPRSKRGRKVRNPYPSKTQKNPLFRLPDDQCLQSAFCDPILLEQGYWLADSELLVDMPRKDKKEEKIEKENSEIDDEEMKKEKILEEPRRCSHCQSMKTPQWRAGPMGPKTLCNACGMRYIKSGKLLPEYRPANSPTFVSYKHSNSHKKVLQMRMALVSPSTSL